MDKNNLKAHRLYIYDNHYPIELARINGGIWVFAYDLIRGPIRETLKLPHYSTKQLTECFGSANVRIYHGVRLRKVSRYQKTAVIRVSSVVDILTTGSWWRREGVKEFLPVFQGFLIGFEKDVPAIIQDPVECLEKVPALDPSVRNAVAPAGYLMNNPIVSTNLQGQVQGIARALSVLEKRVNAVSEVVSRLLDSKDNWIDKHNDLRCELEEYSDNNRLTVVDDLEMKINAFAAEWEAKLTQKENHLLWILKKSQENKEVEKPGFFKRLFNRS